MLMLCGGATLLLAFSTWYTQGTPNPLLLKQLTHAEFGAGFTAWDLVMPLFIFIVGAGMPFAFEKYRQKGGKWWRVSTSLRMVRRIALLFILGMVVQGNLCSANTEHMSLFCNTLQAIAEGYLIAGIIMMCGGIRTQIAACCTLLVLYWALLRFVPYSGNPGGLFLPDNNMAIFIDHKLQGHWQDGTHLDSHLAFFRGSYPAGGIRWSSNTPYTTPVKIRWYIVSPCYRLLADRLPAFFLYTNQ